ncbi:MAG: fused MFS/spermidine synthase [Syntrophales bacterium]
MKKVSLLYVLSFLAAFLLFQIELIIAKIFLPKFGGSYLVWGACLVFFQFALLGGYWYSHVAIKKFGMYRYSFLHLLILALPLLSFPGRSLPQIVAHGAIPLVIDVFLQLTLTIGPAFFVLSTISIVTQSWLAHSDLPEQRNPYMLYAVSNVGSFLGLLSYPFLFELYFDLDTQLTLWRILYFLFLLFYLLALAVIRVANRSIAGFTFFDKSRFRRHYRLSDEPVRLRLYWLLLSAGGCIIFLSVTNVITYEITPCPLLWIIPLCIYLGSFALTFRDRPLYPRWIGDKLPVVLGLSVVLYYFAQARVLPVSPFLIAFIGALFVLCMFCQYELYQSRPEDKADLTGFYLWVSFGGFAGSLFVAWLAPLLFTAPIEFLVGLFVIGLAQLVRQGGVRPTLSDWRLIAYLAVYLIAWPLLFKQYNLFGVALILVSFGLIFRELSLRASALSAALLVVLVLTPFSDRNWNRDGTSIGAHRNYYGMYKVNLRWPVLTLLNGTTLHGAQYLNDDRAKREPLTYYHRNTGVGRVLDSGRFPTRRVGIVGLGIGTLSAYGKKGDVIDFFELDPDLAFLTEPFAYLRNAQATLTITYQDARIALRRSPRGIYDILIIDAFSGDSVPTHLLTTEAIGEYRERIKGPGMILFHVSNRYLTLESVLASNARSVGALALSSVNPQESDVLLSSEWVAVTWDADTHAALADLWKQDPRQPAADTVRPWTDGYSPVLSVLRPETLLTSLKTFTPFSW